MLKPLMSAKTLYSPILLILLLSFMLNTYGIWWGLPSPHGWAPDEVTPYSVRSGIDKLFSNGWHERYPPFHYYVLSFLYSPFAAIHWVNSTAISKETIITALFYVGRFTSVLMGTATILVVYLCGLEIYDRRASLFAAIISTLIAPFIYYSKITNLDVPYILWFALSLLFYVRILKNHKITDYLLFTTTSIISICTKDQAYGLYILTSLVICISLYKHKRKVKPCSSISSCLFDRRIILSIMLATTLFILFHNLLFNMYGFISHINLITGPASKNYQIYENNISGHLKMLWQSFLHLRFSFGWPVYLVCLLGFVSSFLIGKKNKLLFAILVPCLSYYLFYISFILYNYDRFFMPICLIMALFGGKFLSDFLNRTPISYRIKLAFISITFVYTLIYANSVNILMVNDSRYYVEKWMRQNINASSLLMSVGYQEYLPRLQGYRNTSRMMPNIEDLTRTRPDYLIITSNYDITRFKENTPSYDFFVALGNEALGYKLVLKYKEKPRWILLNYEDIFTNIDKINPEIRIYRIDS